MILFAILIQLLLVTFTAGIQETVSELFTSFQNWKYGKFYFLQAKHSNDWKYLFFF